MPPRTVMVVAAHPDDEVIGAGGLLGRLAGATVVHVTDGAPRDLADARAAGFATAPAYAAARHREVQAALALVPRGRVTLIGAGVPDQEATYALADLTRLVRRLLRESRPEVVLTHPLEGGHPDHDAVAFAVHAAARLMARARERPPRLCEFTSYHARGGALVVGDFLAGTGSLPRLLRLRTYERARKRRMLHCFASQARTLRPFVSRLAVERFRPAPRYCFTAPPHPGPLWYDRFRWGGLTGERWRALAAGALDELELTEPL